MLSQQDYEESFESSRLTPHLDWKRIMVASELFIRRELKRPYPRVHYNPLRAALRYVHMVDYYKQKKER